MAGRESTATGLVAGVESMWDRSGVRVIERLEAGIAEDREKGSQLWASLRGEPAVRAALGEARAGVPMRDDTLAFWISNAKPVMGVAFGQLMERGLVAQGDRVADHLPAFGCLGKEDITLRHLLTHTAGFRDAWRDWSAGHSFEEVVDVICRSPQEEDWVAGKTSGYNVAGAWYVLAAVLHEVVFVAMRIHFFIARSFAAARSRVSS